MMIRVNVRKIACAVALGLVLAAQPAAAQDDGDAQAGRGGRGGRGGAPAVVRTPKQIAPVDFTGYWMDIGRPDEYDEANRVFEELKPLLLRDRLKEKV